MEKTHMLATRVDSALLERFRKTCKQLGFRQKHVIGSLLNYFLDNLTEKGKIELVRTGLFGREVD